MERGLRQREEPVFCPGTLRGPVRATGEDGFRIGPEDGEGRACVALLIVEGNMLQVVAEKRREVGTVVNDDICAGVRGRIITPEKP